MISDKHPVGIWLAIAVTRDGVETGGQPFINHFVLVRTYCPVSVGDAILVIEKEGVPLS